MRIDNKQYWRVILLVGATAIVALTLWSSGTIARRLRAEEQLKVDLWYEAIIQREQLVGYTNVLFASLKQEEMDKGDLIGEAYREIQKAGTEGSGNLSITIPIIQKNRTIPILVYKDGEMQFSRNVDSTWTSVQLDSLRAEMEANGTFISFEESDLTVYYAQSNRFRELQQVLDDIINSFISETVLNSASIPVLLTDSSMTRILRACLLYTSPSPRD